MILNKSSMMLANFISRSWLHKDINMFLKIQKKAVRKKMRNN